MLDPHAYTLCLMTVLFCRSLPEPLMSFKLHDSFIKAASKYDLYGQKQTNLDLILNRYVLLLFCC